METGESGSISSLEVASLSVPSARAKIGQALRRRAKKAWSRWDQLVAMETAEPGEVA